jgi:transcriptional regulator with XRE-family HTH domain
LDSRLFSHELRQYRIDNALTRTDAAALLNVSPSTLRRWEDNRATPQSATLWNILARLNSPVVQRFRSYGDVAQLKDIIERYARSLDLSPVESYRNKLSRIERTLSGSILRASQTDFIFDDASKALKPVPFVQDLDLFRSAREISVRQLLHDAYHSADELIPKLDGINLEQRYLADALRVYSAQCREDTPNPRILERKGTLIRFVLSSEDISHAVNRFLYKELEQFVDVHNELMRGYFGSALNELRAVSSDSVKDEAAEIAPQQLVSALAELARFVNPEAKAAGRVHPETVAILDDVRSEVDELVSAYHSSNDPSQRALRLARVKVASMHGALFIGRCLHSR